MKKKFKNFNNSIKHIIINKHIVKDATILDFCAGKGGDLKKWYCLFIRELFFTDSSVKLISLAIKRYNYIYKSLKKDIFPCTFIITDCFQKLLNNIFDLNIWFDLISCQFALHYAFESEKQVRAMLKNVSSRLKQGGYFIGTTPDSNRLVKKWRKEPYGKHCFGNKYYQIIFCPKNKKQKEKKLNPQKPFGIKYFFNLNNSINQCPEFLLHIPTLKNIAEEYGLSLYFECNFQEFFIQQFNIKYLDLFKKMDIIFNQKLISNQEWEIVSLYIVFVFRKISSTNHEVNIRGEKKRKRINLKDVIILK